jgi:hypothetical protein
VLRPQIIDGRPTLSGRHGDFEPHALEQRGQLLEPDFIAPAALEGGNRGAAHTERAREFLL